MALTEVENIYQAAIDLIGEHELSSSSDTSLKPYSTCARQYPQARDEIIRGYAWNEATELALCLESATKPAHTWSFKFPLPDDCLRPIHTSKPRLDWRVLGGFIYTNYKLTPDSYSVGTTYYANQYISNSDITYKVNTTFTATAWATDILKCTSQGDDYGFVELEYVKELTNPLDWSAQLKQAIILNLATKIVIPITGDYRKKQALAEELYRIVLPLNHGLDAIQGKPKQIFYSDYHNSRGEI